MIYEVALSVLLFFSSQLIYYEKDKKCNWLSASQKFRGSIQVYTSLHVHVANYRTPCFQCICQSVSTYVQMLDKV